MSMGNDPRVGHPPGTTDEALSWLNRVANGEPWLHLVSLRESVRSVVREIAALRAENERLREALRHAARELAYVAMYEEVGGPDLVHTSEGDAVIALAEKLLGPMATWPEEPNAGMRAFLAGGKPNV